MKAVALNTPLQRRTSCAAVAAQLCGALVGAFALFREWRRRVRSREDLARLDDRMLRDIGIMRAEACFEVSKPFWRK